MARTTEKCRCPRDGSVRIRVLDPTARGPKPALIYLHGGGWTLFSIDTHDRIMREYAARAGIVVIAVDDPCFAGGEVSSRDRGDRGRSALAAGERRGPSAVDARSPCDRRDSAGAALTFGACLMLREAGELDVIQGMLLNYGAFDTNCDTESFRRYGHGGYMWDPGEMDCYWRNYLRDEADFRIRWPYRCSRTEGTAAGLSRRPRMRCSLRRQHRHGRETAQRRRGGADLGVSGRDAQLPRSGLGRASQ